MDQDTVAPAWLAAVSAEGELTFLDVRSLLVGGRDPVLSTLRNRRRGHVDRLWIETDCGWLTAFLDPGSGIPSTRERVNRYALDLLARLGRPVEVCVGTCLILGMQDGREAGLTDQQAEMLSQELVIAAVS